LRGERPQQMRLTVDQIRQRLRRQRPGSKVGHPPLGIGDAARPPPRVAGASLHETSARIARTRQKRIRTKLLRLLDSRREKQVATGQRRPVGNDFRQKRGPGAKGGRHIGSPYVFIKIYSARAADAVGMEPRQVDAKGSCAREREPPQKASDDRFGGERTSHCDRDDGAVAPKNEPARAGGERSSRSVHFIEVTRGSG
jgi:hypothetical protein